MPGFGCLRAEGENRPSRPSTCIVGVFMGGQGEKAGGIAYSEKAAPTLRAVNSGSNQVPDIVYPDVARTLTAEHDSSPCTDRGQNVVVHAAGFNDSVGERAQGGMEYTEERSPTLRSGDVRAVVYDCRGNGGGGVSPTMTGDHQNRVTDYTAIAVYDTTQITSPLNYSNPKPGDACHPLASQQHPPLAVYPEVTGALCANSHPGSYTGQDAFNDMLPVTPSDKPPRRYIVRRLTPLECCRLQGYPDGWTENLAIENPTDEQIDFFTEVWALWAAINGTKPKSRNQVIKWLKDPQSDSAEYKAYGNSLAIPCAADVMGRVAKALREDE